MLAINMLLQVNTEIRKQIDFLKFQIYLGVGNQYIAINRTGTYSTLSLVMPGWDDPVRQCPFSISFQL